MTRKLKSALGRSTADKIFVRGHDLTEELIGKVSLGDVAFLELKGRLPKPQESIMFNALVVTLVEHGLTPSTHRRPPDLFRRPRGAAGGRGGRPAGYGRSVRRLDRAGCQDAAGGARRRRPGQDRARDRRLAQGHQKQVIPGLGHPVHKPADPRTTRLFALAAENGFAGRHVDLMGRIAERATEAYGRDLPVNATGAIAAIASEMEIPWRICRGLAVMGRAIGLVAHLQEEMEDPMAPEIWSRVEDEASSDGRSDRD